MKYAYMLQFGSYLTNQSQLDEVSRILDNITGKLSYKNICMDIDANVTVSAIRVMLHMLSLSGMAAVAYCPVCDKYVVSDNVNETICAYDSIGHADSHHIYKIGIREVQERTPNCSCLVKYITTNEDWDISRDETDDGSVIRFFLHETKSVGMEEIYHMNSLGGFAGVQIENGCLCILVKVDQLKFEGDL